jgi:hypothetical protein
MAAHRQLLTRALFVLGFLGLLAIAFRIGLRDGNRIGEHPDDKSRGPDANLKYQPRLPELDTGGFQLVLGSMDRWEPTATLAEIGRVWKGSAPRAESKFDRLLADHSIPAESRIEYLLHRTSAHLYAGQPTEAYSRICNARVLAESAPGLAARWLYTIVYFQGVTALRMGETENCVLCRGESSCIIPVAPSAVHTKPEGARLAIKHFTEYLTRFPDDFQVQWLLNVAHMVLGEHPNAVEPKYLIRLDPFTKSEFDIGRFRDVGARVGLTRLNEAGATIMDDFDNDGLLDILFTSWDASVSVVLYKNAGDGTFTDVTEKAGLSGQLGGLGVVQADFDNDGHLDLFLPRGAWLEHAIRPSLLRNNGNGTFTDVTEKAGLAGALNSDTAQWADFDNDGRVDLFIACERQPVRLYRNNGNGTFTDVADAAGLAPNTGMWKGCAWLDYDNDRYPDLFLNDLKGTAKLFHNNRNGTFTEVTKILGIDGPKEGLSCWAFDYDNDGYEDLFATSFDHTVADVVNGLLGRSHACQSNRLYRNVGGKKFVDVTKEAGLDLCFSSMGTNFGDLNNDGYLDFYLGTGDHDLASLVPNRMFLNVGGKRFADITGTSGTGNLQKGHGVAIGDWDRNGTADVLIQMGGALPGDGYHNLLFQNPGQGNNWLNLKLVGTKSNRAAIGARIKVVTAGPNPQTIYRTVCSGSSFGANPLEQLIGLGKADRVALVEVTWPTSNTTQTFRDVNANRALEITEGETEPKPRAYKPIALPK